MRTLQQSCVLAVLLFLSVEAFNHGRPLCRNPEDFNRGWSFKNDPAQYWTCTSFGVSELRDCQQGQTFSELYLMCTIPGAIIGDFDRQPLVQCKPGESIDLSGDPFCTAVNCDDGLVVYNPEGHPVCHRESSNHIQLCPGAPATKRTKGTASCAMPKCSQEEFQSNRMFPSTDPTQFHRCAHVGYPVTFKCSAGLCYDAQSQACVWPLAWSNVCV